MKKFDMKGFLTEQKLPSTVSTLSKEIKSLGRDIDGHLKSIGTQVDDEIDNLPMEIPSEVDYAISARSPDFLYEVTEDISDKIDELEMLAVEVSDTISALKRVKPLIISLRRELDKVVALEAKE